MSNILFPPEIYKWLVSIDVIPNQGILNEKNMVAISPSLAVHFQSGFNIGKIVSTIMKRNGQKIPSCLESVKPDNSKNSRLTNWNFVWLSFEDLRMQFDGRIKDLILQGEVALIIQIIKQLYEKDEKKDPAKINDIKIKEKRQKVQRQQKQANKHTALDIRKLNLQKDPQQAQSSLEFLILLLTNSLNMTVEEILGLFTNQNKYLAHIIAKGLNDDFTAIILFYTLLNKYQAKLKKFCEDDPRDAQSCLYAIKPGFISKSERVSELTVRIFSRVGNIYDWFVSDDNRGATTLLLGLKRHPQLVDIYWELLTDIIQNQQIDFFTTHFKKSFRDPFDMIETCLIFFQNLSESYLANKVMDVGILAQWLQIAVGLYQNPLQFKLLSYKFIGEVMTYFPQAIEQNQECLIVFRKSWQDHKITDFIFLIDQVILILERLVEVKNTMARRMYQIIIQIFELVSNIGHQDKKQYLVQNFNQILPNLPGIPSQFLIETYTQQYIRSSDYVLISESVNCNNDINGLIRIGEVVLRMFSRGPVVNCYQGPLLYKICKKVSEDESGIMFIKKVLKDCLHQYGKIELEKKPAAIVVPQPMYFNKKGNSKKLSPQQTEKFYIQEKQTNNLIELIEKLIDFIKILQNQHLLYQVKQDLLTANAFIRQNNYKVGSKHLSNILQKKFAISKDEELTYDDQYRIKKDAQLEQSMIKRKMANSIISNNGPAIKAGPEHLTRQFQQIADKRRKEQIAKKIQNQKKNKQQAFKKILVKKELERVYLMKGFSGQVELKQEGFWEKLVKQDKELQVIPSSAIQARDLEYIQNLFKKYHRVVRSLFLKYTSTMYWKTKSVSSFDDQYNRTQAISVVELIKFLKDYKLFFLTSKEEVQALTRDVNVKLLNRQQVTQQLDFQGFELFIQQFCYLNFIRPHTISVKTVSGNHQSVKKDMKHLSYCHLIQQFFFYMRQVFQEKNENTALFDEPQAAYFNESEVIKEFNRKLQADPGFILPQGYKKITEKVITFNQNYSEKNTGIKQSYLDVLQVLDQIFFQSDLKIRLIEPITQKMMKARVKPQAFTNVKARLSESMEGSKIKAFSTLAQKKTPNIPPVKMMQKKTLSFGMKLGLSYVPYRDKLIGEQVAYVIDDILDAVQKGRNTIQKQKVVNEIIRQRRQMQSRQRKAQSQREKKRKQRKQQLQKLKQQITDKKQKELQQTKQDRQKKKKKQQQKQKRKKQDIEKYLQEQKKKLKEKKERQESEQKKKKEEENKKKKQGFKKNQEKFKDFNKKQIQKLQKEFEDEGTKKKKAQQEEEKEKSHKEEVYKKLRSRIQSQDNKIKEIKLRTNEQISELYQSPAIQKVFRQFEPNLRALFDFLIKNTYTSLTERKHNNEIVYETWQYFHIAFQLNPLIVTPKNIMSIFKALTKDKQVSKQYFLGLNFAEFQQALLRIAIKHKSVFNKLAQKIKQDTMSQKQIDAVVQKDIEQKQKNEFEEPKQIDIKSLLKEQDVKKQIFDDYGDIGKVDQRTLKGLIYYLKVPKDKFNQEKRFRQVLAEKPKHAVKTQKLKQKLNEQYSMPSPPKKKRITKNADNLKSSGGEGQEQGAADSQ